MNASADFWREPVIDHQFNTVDVCIIVNARTIVSKYHRFYMAQHGERKAA